MNPIAISNDNVIFIAWRYDKPIENCLGFAIYREDPRANKAEPLPAWVPFCPKKNPDWKRSTTEKWPIQKFSWCDLTAPAGGPYTYRIVPMVGDPDHLKPAADKSLTLRTKSVTLTADRGKFAAYFNRGILSTQALARALPKSKGGTPSLVKLKDFIADPKNAIRKRLAGKVVSALGSLLQRAESEGGRCYLALYELNDPELVEALRDKDYVHLILSNSATEVKKNKQTGEKTVTVDATNKQARQLLHNSHTDISDRMLKGGHIGHNKFMVYVDKSNQPQAVLTGSTNWTSTGLCAQANNALVIESPELAQAYLDYWHKLKGDKAQQDAPLRQWDQNTPALPPPPNPGDKLKVWFSPNTKEKTKPKKNPPQPVDMKEVFEIIAGAKQAVLFLAFIPGSPSIMDAIHDLQTKKPHLFIRGAVSDPKTVALYHRRGDRSDARVVSVGGVPDQFGSWAKELYKLGHAVIHDKVVVVDPFSANCAVITGSHNLGFKASYQNDENMVIIRGDKQVAAAYATHVMDIYDHYRWRYHLQLQKAKDQKQKTRKNAWTCLSTKPSWQDIYFKQDSPYRREIEFWTG